MAELSADTVVGVIGAGAMGSGIAQVAATNGHQVLLFDQDAAALDRAMSSIEKNLARSVEKSRLTREVADLIRSRIQTADWETPAPGYADLSKAGFVIEAIVEDLAVKRELFGSLEKSVAPDAILATNTSSLSVTAIARACNRPERVIGVHFFNPPTVMQLVEIVPGLATSADVTQRAT